MSEDWFWGLVQRSREGTQDLDEQADKLVHLLVDLEPDDILEFQRQFSGCVQDAYRWDVMAVAHIVHGGCSGEDFDAFVGWLVAQGREYFDTAMRDPARAADAITPGGAASFTAMWTAPAEAYQHQTGEDDFWDVADAVSIAMQGDRWQEVDLPHMFPELCERFGR